MLSMSAMRYDIYAQNKTECYKCKKCGDVIES